MKELTKIAKEINAEIADRAVEEVMKRFAYPSNASKCIGIRSRVINSWRVDKVCPNGAALQKLHAAGIDVIYILSGERAPKRYR